MFETVLDIVKKSMLQYLDEVLSRNSQEKHDQIRQMFDAHMEQIAQYCIANYMDKPELTIPFIKGLHKIFFPKGYTQTVKLPTGGMIVSMIPGQYKTLENTGVSYLNLWTEANLVAPAEVKESMDRLVSEFNFTLTKATTNKEKKDRILYFMLDFVHIHPFWDANGRVIGILTNLLFVKQNFPPIHFDIIKKKNLPGFFRAIELSWKTRDLQCLYDVIEKYGS